MSGANGTRLLKNRIIAAQILLNSSLKPMEAYFNSYRRGKRIQSSDEFYTVYVRLYRTIRPHADARKSARIAHAYFAEDGLYSTLDEAIQSMLAMFSPTTGSAQILTFT